MHVRTLIFAGLFGIFAPPTSVNANSCSNVSVHGSFDRSGLQINEYGISAAGTFRIVGETDEIKQPMFNLTTINRLKKSNNATSSDLECKVTAAIVWSNREKPNIDVPNCQLDLEFSEYSMREIQHGVFVGMGSSGECFTTMLVIDVSKNNASLSFARSKEADEIDSNIPKMCGASPRTQTLMNCTAWAGLRHKGGESQPRYCDFGGVDSK
jgi:hypothetical protein